MNYLKRIKRTAWLAIGMALVIFVSGLLFFNYSGKAREKDLLALNIDTLDKTLSVVASQIQSVQNEKTQLEGRLPSANASLEQAQAAHYLPVDSIEYGEEFFSVAGRHRVRILNISSTTPVVQVEGGISYLVMGIEIDLSGDLDGVTGFVHDVATISDLDGIYINSFTASGSSERDLSVHLSISGYKYKG